MHSCNRTLVLGKFIFINADSQIINIGALFEELRMAEIFASVCFSAKFIQMIDQRR